MTNEGPGDPLAPEVLAELQASVRRYCRARLSSDHDTDDAVQDAFLRLLTKQSDPPRQPESWLIHAAGYVCADLHRRAGRDPLALGEVKSPTIEDPADAIAVAGLVAHLLDALPNREAEALRGMYLYDLPETVLAQRMGVSPGNLRVLAYRGRRRARKLLALIDHGLGVLLLPRAWSARLNRRRAARQLRLPSLPMGGLSAFAHVDALLISVLALTFAVPPAVSVAAPGTRNPTGTTVSSAAVTLDPQSSMPMATPVNLNPSGPTQHPQTTEGPILSPAYLDHTVLSPSSGARPEDASFNAITTSPRFSVDHTVFASGGLINGCMFNCWVVFKSTDAGRSWMPLPSTRFTGGRILLTPNYPRDPTMFAVGSAGLQRSDDGGSTFNTVVAGAVSAAVDPSSDVGHARVVTAISQALFVYDAASGLVTPGPTLPPSAWSLGDLGFTGFGQLAVTGTSGLGIPHGLSSFVALCSSTACSYRYTKPDFGTMAMVVSGSDIAAYARGILVLSHDGGGSFLSRTLGSEPTAIAFSPTPGPGRALMIASAVEGRPLDGNVEITADDGQHLKRLDAASQLGPISSLGWLPNGDVLAAIFNPDPQGFGLRCSGDPGGHWEHFC